MTFYVVPSGLEPFVRFQMNILITPILRSLDRETKARLSFSLR